MSPKTFTHYAQVVLMTAMLWSIGVQAAPLAIPDTPLFLTSTGVSPNLVITFDDSGSMRRGWVPESVTSDQAIIDGPRFKSASVNGIYYNPKLTYNIPTRSDGTAYTTSFTNAYFNGFDISKGSVNLSNNYKVVGQATPTHTYSSCTNTLVEDNYTDCRLVKNPATIAITTNTATCTNVAFTDQGVRRNGTPRDDTIQINGSGTGCSTFFQTISAGAVVTVTGSGSRNGTYTVANVQDARTISINNAFTSSTTTTATLTWVATTTTGGTAAAVPAYYYLYYQDKPGQSQPSTCITPSRTNDTCYVKVVVNSTSGVDRNNDGTISASEADERENFARWYSFYRTRSLAVMSGAMSSVSSLEDNDVRLGWQSINQCTSFGTTCQGYDNLNHENRLKVLNLAEKTNFYNWLQRFDVSGTTPLRSALRRVGNYYSLATGGKDNPYAYDPYVAEFSPYQLTLPAADRKVYACRKNFNVLFTDGLWNSETYTMGDVDSAGTTPLGDTTRLTDANGTVTFINSYSPRAPYKDVSVTPGGGTYTNTDSLSDTALYYWAQDLRPDLDNKISPTSRDFLGTETDQFWNPKNDPATWQHMVNYTIGLGLSASLVPGCYFRTGSIATTPSTLIRDPNNPTPGCPAWQGDMYAGDYDDLVAGTLNWPRINSINPTLNEEPDGHVYELWHAAINSRGKFYSADNPDELVKAFQDVMDTVSAAAAPGGGSGVSSNVTKTTETGATAFVAKFKADWSGTLEAFPLNQDGTLGTTGAAGTEIPFWEAGSLIPPGNPDTSRNIFTVSATNRPDSGQAFTIANICNSATNASLKDTLNRQQPNPNGSLGTVDSLCSQRLAWLRGYTAITGASWNVATKIVTFTVPNHGLTVGNVVSVKLVTPTLYNLTYTVASITTDTFTARLDIDPGTYISGGRVLYSSFRDRSSVLGDITDSTTVYAHKDVYAYNVDGYSGPKITVGGGGDSYKTYLAGKTSQTPVVYVGANDGMLHAFNAEVCPDISNLSTCPTDAGRELFAYVPAGVYANLSGLTALAYGKNHKFFVDGTPTLGDAYLDGSWKTYLVAGLRAGGKSIYALDVTNPSSFTAANIKWEFTDPGYLGFTYSQPQIGPISANDEWAAIFGNGYNSNNTDGGSAILYIVNLETGVQIAKINTNTTSNGLSTPYLFDSDGDGIVDVIYAGDLQGNLWKFDKSSGSWGLGNSGHPLFIARNDAGQVQAITTQPIAKLVDILNPDGSKLMTKVMVYFGTGRYLVADDLTNSDVQTFYGIRDDLPDCTKTTCTPVLRTDSNMLEQVIVSSTVTTPLYTTRTVSQNPATTTTKGCYLDLPTPTPVTGPSERVTSSPLIKTFNTSALQTRVIFVTSIPTSDPCDKGGTSWLMELSTSCGRLGGTSPFNVNTDNKFDNSDLVTISPDVTGSVSGVKLATTTGVVTTITIIPDGNLNPDQPEIGKANKLLPGSSGNIENVLNSWDPPSSNSGGPPKRISWEQIQ